MPMLSAMRLGVTLLALALVLLVGAPAGAGANDRTAVLDELVDQLSSSVPTSHGVHHVAFITADRCPKVGVWRMTGPPQVLGPTTCASTPFGLTLGGGAQWATVRTTEAGRRVYTVWWSERGFRSNRDPYSKPKRIVRRTVTQGERVPIVMYDGFFWVDGRLPGVKGAFPAPPASVASAGVHAVVQHASGVIETYLTTSRDPPTVQARYPRSAVKALKGSSVGLFAVLTPGLLDVYRTSALDPGTVAYSVDLPGASSYGDDRCYRPRCTMAELRLADFEWPYAVYVRGRAIHVVDVRSSKDRVVRRPAAGPVHAQIEVTGLTYSHGNRISLVGRSEIEALFRR